MSCFYVSARLRVCSSRALSHLRALFRVGAWCSDPGTHVLSFGSCRVWTLALYVLSCYVSVWSRVRSAVRSPVHVSCGVHAVHVFISCVHSCYVSSLCIYFIGCVLSCCHVLYVHAAYVYLSAKKYNKNKTVKHNTREYI